MESNNKRKMRPALKITIVFIIIAALLTFFSRTIYDMSIPTVHVTKLIEGNLDKKYSADGFIMPVRIENIYAPETLPVKEVLVEENMYYVNGSPVIKLDTSLLEEQLKDMKTEHERLLSQKRYISGKDAKRLYTMDVADSERHIKTMEARIEACKEIKTPFGGMVVELNARNGMMVDRSTPLMRITNASKGYMAVCNVAPDVANWMNINDTVKVRRGTQKTTMEGVIEYYKPQDDGTVQIKALVEDATIVNGEMASIEFHKTTYEYASLIPIAALEANDSSPGPWQTYDIFIVSKKEGPLGDENIVRKKSVTILDRDDEHAYISSTGISKNDWIVTRTDKTLVGGRVKIYQETE